MLVPPRIEEYGEARDLLPDDLKPAFDKRDEKHHVVDES